MRILEIILTGLGAGLITLCQVLFFYYITSDGMFAHSLFVKANALVSKRPWLVNIMKPLILCLACTSSFHSVIGLYLLYDCHGYSIDFLASVFIMYVISMNAFQFGSKIGWTRSRNPQ